jgi:nucleoid DNA-binding protein
MAKAAKKPLTKTQIIASIAEDTGLTKKDVSAVFESMTKLIKKSLGRSGAGSFTLPGILKIEKKRVPARPARKNAPNPFRPGETMDIPAKPAHNKVKVRPLKNLKDMA